MCVVSLGVLSRGCCFFVPFCFLFCRWFWLCGLALSAVPFLFLRPGSGGVVLVFPGCLSVGWSVGWPLRSFGCRPSLFFGLGGFCSGSSLVLLRGFGLAFFLNDIERDNCSLVGRGSPLLLSQAVAPTSPRSHPTHPPRRGSDASGAEL